MCTVMAVSNLVSLSRSQMLWLRWEARAAGVLLQCQPHSKLNQCTWLLEGVCFHLQKNIYGTKKVDQSKDSQNEKSNYYLLRFNCFLKDWGWSFYFFCCCSVNATNNSTRQYKQRRMFILYWWLNWNSAACIKELWFNTNQVVKMRLNSSFIFWFGNQS